MMPNEYALFLVLILHLCIFFLIQIWVQSTAIDVILRLAAASEIWWAFKDQSWSFFLLLSLDSLLYILRFYVYLTLFSALSLISGFCTDLTKSGGYFFALLLLFIYHSILLYFYMLLLSASIVCLYFIFSYLLSFNPLLIISGLWFSLPTGGLK